jgi:hypothetical protein
LLKNIISEIRSYKKLGIDIEIEENEFSDVICKMCQCKIGKTGKKIELYGYKIFLENIKIEIIEKKIQNLEKDEQILKNFMEKINESTPKEISEEKNKKLILIEKEIETLKELL